MKKSRSVLALVAGFALTAAVTAAAMHTAGGAPDKFPEAARRALLQLAGGATISEWESEQEHGVMTYEAEWSVGGNSHEAEVTADGTLIEMEETIPADQVPAAVAAVIAAQFGANAEVTVQKATFIMYEVEAKVNGRKKEIYISPTGRLHEHDDDDDEQEDEADESNGD